jgi:hypothetical protein
MAATRHTFATADVTVGEGPCRRHGKVRDVNLTIETAPHGFRPTPGIKDAFLNGSIRAEGTLVEECRPHASLLGKGREAVLRLTAGGHHALVSVLLLELGPIRSPEKGIRHYDWSFLVTGKPRDPLGLFPGPAGKDGGELGVEDLLSLLGAGSDDLGRAEDDQAVTFNAEGGFRLEAAPNKAR